MDVIVLFLPELSDLTVPLNDHGKRGSLYAANSQALIIQRSEKPCDVDSDQPIRFRPAERSAKEIVVTATILQRRKALLNGRVLHRADP